MSISDTHSGLKGRWLRLLVVLAGILLGQTALYGPSLIGKKILLPLDILAQPNVYLPLTDAVKAIRPHEPNRSDLIMLFEPARRFAAAELDAGRLPLWAPYQYAGVPFIWPKFSPFCALQSCTASPKILGWSQLLASMVAGLGFYLFGRRVLSVSSWPAAICAWCYPLTGYFVLWQGFPTAGPVYWFPWLLVAVHQTACHASLVSITGLSVITALVAVSGHLDGAGQTLLASGVFGLWTVIDYRRSSKCLTPSSRALARLALGWTLGLMLAAPYILPTLEYSRTGARMARRSVGEEERPPVGISALPQVVLPDVYGRCQHDSIRTVPGVEIESSAAGYGGVLATLVVAPLAFRSGRHARTSIFWLLFALFGVSWCLNVPGIVQVLRLPGLNMMSHNRLVFITCLAILALTAIGLEMLLKQPISRSYWLYLPGVVLVGLGSCCLYRSYSAPQQITAELTAAVENGQSTPWWWIHNVDDVQVVSMWFKRHYLASAAWCGLGVAVWVIVWLRHPCQHKLLPVIGALLVADLLCFAQGRNVQCDPNLYFPPVPVLKQVAGAPPGRVIGYKCLPASLAFISGLKDIRGYDGVDPAEFIALMALGGDLRSDVLDFAQTQWLAPELTKTANGEVRLAPVMDMLGVRYIIFRGKPPADVVPAFVDFDYWVLTNSAALPRAYVPQRIETIVDWDLRLKKLAAPTFAPRQIAYVEAQLELPQDCRGTVEITSENPVNIQIAVDMQTPGMVVLTDLWDQGWHARFNGRPAPILRVNHAVRGVVVPAGKGTLEFRYWPESLTLGFGSCGFALGILGLLLGRAVWSNRRALG